LNNTQADSISRIHSYYSYLALGYDKLTAKSMAGLKKIENEKIQ
jgi:hypothetical protein